MSRPLELAALLAMPDNGEVTRVAGPLAAAWDGVVIEADEASLPSEGASRLAVLTQRAPETPWQRDALVRRLGDRGYLGLAVPGADGFSQGTRRLADRLGLSLLDVERPLRLARACWMLLESRDALTLSAVRKTAQAFEYPAQDLPDLLRHLAANLGYGLALLDPGGVLHEAGGHVSDELRSLIDFGPWIDVARTAGQSAASVKVDAPGRPGLRLAAFGDGLGDPQLASLAVAVEVAMPAVAARILIDEVAAVNDAAVSSGLLRDFLDLRGAPDPEVERRMAERGWRTSGHHLGIRFIGRSRLDPLELLRSVTRELGTIAADTHATTSGRGVAAWLAFATRPTPAEAARLVSGLRQAHLSLRRTFNIATGVGSLADGAAGLASTLSEAADAARVASNRSGTGWFVRVDGLGVEQLLLAWTETDTFVPAAQSLLAPLREESGDLLRTLSAYLDHESGIAATAAALGVHRNTVAARMHRVQELLGVDLEDPEARLALHLACRAVLN
ncbi:helix-turn-helix domain-containing protein [Agromyces mediolanus]|uniref:PucR family transcriptional regulator n=1 Tax=Agromyces mediolanus TaxID=41986 RepID=UPI0038379945